MSKQIQIHHCRNREAGEHNNMKAAAALILLLPLTFGFSGVDVSSYVDTWSCIKSHGHEFAIIRGYQSFGAVDPNAARTIEAAKKAGIKSVDTYFFPCVPCGNPTHQADAFWSALGGKFDKVWLDIEVYHWSSDKTSNREFITSLADRLASKGAKIGIYTSLYNWSSIVGEDWKDMSKYHLWYAHYDGNPSFSDFQAFGGWSKPSIKQYNGGTDLCSASVDLDWYP